VLDDLLLLPAERVVTEYAVQDLRRRIAGFIAGQTHAAILWPAPVIDSG
jgi:hypothetical protein